jgi:hypothetical protein
MLAFCRSFHHLGEDEVDVGELRLRCRLQEREGRSWTRRRMGGGRADRWHANAMRVVASPAAGAGAALRPEQSDEQFAVRRRINKTNGGFESEREREGSRLQPLHLLQLPAASAYGRAQCSLIGGGACGMRRGRRGDGGGGGTRHALLELCQWKLCARVALGEQVEDGQQRVCRGGSWGRCKGGGGGGGGRARAG